MFILFLFLLGLCQTLIALGIIVFTSPIPLPWSFIVAGSMVFIGLAYRKLIFWAFKDSFIDYWEYQKRHNILKRRK